MIVGRSGSPAASVIIPAYNSKDTISPVLSALASQETELAYELIFVDSSGDGACKLVREHFPKVQVIESKERLFPGAARNLGAEQASGKLIGFVDSDCIAAADWLSAMWETHQKWDCAAVAGSILNANPQYLASISSYMNEFSDFFPYGSLRYVDYLPSGNLSYKAEVFRKYGGFDSKEPMYEDLIFNKLLSKSGEKLLFNPAICVAHNHRTGFREYLSHEFRRGKGATVARRRGLLVGKSWTKYPVLALLATPGLFMRKATVFPYRFTRAYPTQTPRMLQALPYFYLALVIWHCGFLTDIMHNRRLADK